MLEMRCGICVCEMSCVGDEVCEMFTYVGLPDADRYRDQVQLSLGCYVPTAETHVQVRCTGHAIFLHSIFVWNGSVRRTDSQGLRSC